MSLFSRRGHRRRGQGSKFQRLAFRDAHDLAQENAVAVSRPRSLRVAREGAENSEACDVGWYGDMSFVPIYGV